MRTTSNGAVRSGEGRRKRAQWQRASYVQQQHKRVRTKPLPRLVVRAKRCRPLSRIPSQTRMSSPSSQCGFTRIGTCVWSCRRGYVSWRRLPKHGSVWRTRHTEGRKVSNKRRAQRQPRQ
jgi:hypothetical protein